MKQDKVRFKGNVDDRTTQFVSKDKDGPSILIGSTGGYDDGFLARITLAKGIHLQLFPKYGLVAMEVASNGNTNLPAACTSEELLQHMFGSSGKERVYAKHVEAKQVRFSRNRVIHAIKQLKEIAKAKHEEWNLRRGHDWSDD